MSSNVRRAEMLIALTHERWPIDPPTNTAGFLKDSVEARAERREEASVIVLIEIATQLTRIANHLEGKNE